MQPGKNLEFLGVEINSKDMILTLPEEAKNKIVEQCQFLLRKQSATIRELTQVMYRLELTAMAFLSTALQYRAAFQSVSSPIQYPVNFHSVESFRKINLCANVQHSCRMSYLIKMEGYTKQNFVSVEQRHLRILSKKRGS